MTAVMTARPAQAVLVVPGRRAPWAHATVWGVLGFAATWAGSWVPSFWGDEAASVMSAERSLPSLLRMLGSVDAVHGAYYLFLHFWIDVFGASELSVRLPSAIAVGFAVAGTFVIGRMLMGTRSAAVAALLCAVLPRTSLIGAEARSYGTSAAVAAWITVLFLVLLQHRFVRRSTASLAWLGYAVGFALGMYLFLYLGLLLVVHGAFLLGVRSRTHRRSWITAAGVAVGLAIPIIALGYAQRGQIRFLAHRGYATPAAVLTSQWFGNPYLATAAWLVIAGGIVGAAIAWQRTRTGSAVVTLGILWLAMPTIALLTFNTWTPAYNIRYLSFCTPAVALLLAAGVAAIRRRGVRVAVLVALLLLAVPTDIAQRAPYAKDHGSDLAQTAAIIGEEARAGDGVVFDRTTAPRQRPRLATHLYPVSFQDLEDVAIKTSYRDRSRLWDTTYPLSQVTPALAPLHRVWLLELKGSPDNRQGTDLHTLEDDGFTVASKRLVHRTVIYLLERQP